MADRDEALLAEMSYRLRLACAYREEEDLLNDPKTDLVLIAAHDRLWLFETYVPASVLISETAGPLKVVLSGLFANTKEEGLACRLMNGC
jgi:hypothetical protein